MHYLYQHRRLDTGQIFYIGIGTKNKKRNKGHRTEYERAYCIQKRTDFWKSIALKTKYSVEIVLESDDVEFIRKKEIELIKFYGRRNIDKYGTLVNFSEGGEFNNGFKNRNIVILQLDLSGKLIKRWEQLADIQREKGFLKSNIVKCCRKKQITAYGFKWKYENNGDFDNVRASTARKKNTNRGVGIIAICRNNGTKTEFRTVVECAEFFNLNRSTIHKYLNENKKHKTHDIIYRQWQKKQ